MLSQLILGLMLMKPAIPRQFVFKTDAGQKVTWQIELVPDVIIAQGQRYDGMTYCGAHKVALWSDADDLREVLFHELQHVVTNCDQQDSTTLHKVIYRISPGMVRILRANPKLSNYLVK